MVVCMYGGVAVVFSVRRGRGGTPLARFFPHTSHLKTKTKKRKKEKKKKRKMSKRVPRHKPKAKVQRPLPPASSISCGTTPCSCKNGSRAVNAINERGELVFKRCEQLEEDVKRKREAALREKHYIQLHTLRERHLREMEADTRDESKKETRRMYQQMAIEDMERTHAAREEKLYCSNRNITYVPPRTLLDGYISGG